MVTDEDDVGEIEEICEEWQEGVFSADSPAESAICRSGTEGSARRLLCVCINKLARVVHRASLYSSLNMLEGFIRTKLGLTS